MDGICFQTEQPEPDSSLSERLAVLGCLATMQTPVAIAAQLKADRVRVGVVLRRLVDEGAALRLGHGRYAPSGKPCAPTVVRTRLQPIRDMLLAYLHESRKVGDIARHIDRTIPITTGHLGQMIRLGLVVRVAYGVYQLRNTCAHPPEPETIERGRPVEDQVRRIVDREKSLRQICDEAGRSARAVRPHLQKLVRERGIERVGDNFFRPLSPDLFAAD